MWGMCHEQMLPQFALWQQQVFASFLSLQDHVYTEFVLLGSLFATCLAKVLLLQLIP